MTFLNILGFFWNLLPCVGTCFAGQSKTQEGPWGRRGTRLEHEGTSLCMGNGSSMDISEKMSACSETGRDWTFYEKKRMVESARKKDTLLWKTHISQPKLLFRGMVGFLPASLACRTTVRSCV